MNRTALILGLIITSLIIVSCAPYDQRLPLRTKQTVIRCDKYPHTAATDVPAELYVAKESGTCLVDMGPFDQYGWWESNMNSRPLRGQTTAILGCTHCPEGTRDCDSFSNCGGCNTVMYQFDFTQIQHDAEVVDAKLAVQVVSKPELMGDSFLQGRVNVGGDYAVIADPPEMMGNWAVYDITSFVCRAVLERRNSTTLELSLPCGPDGRSRLATVAMTKGNTFSQASSGINYSSQAGPRIIIEYR